MAELDSGASLSHHLGLPLSRSCLSLSLSLSFLERGPAVPLLVRSSGWISHARASRQYRKTRRRHGLASLVSPMMYSWWLPRVGRTSSDARKLARTEQHLDPPTILLFLSFCLIFFFPSHYPKIYVSLFRVGEKKILFSNNLRHRTILLEICFFFESFKVEFREISKSSIFARIVSIIGVERRNAVGKIGGTGEAWKWKNDGGLERIGRVHERDRRGRWKWSGKVERQAWYEAIASGSVLHRGRDTVCTRARNAFQRRWVRAWNRCTLEKAYIPYTSFSSGARCTRNDRNSPRRTCDPEVSLLATIYRSIRSVCRLLCVCCSTYIRARARVLSLSPSLVCKMILERSFRFIFPIFESIFIFF